MFTESTVTIMDDWNFGKFSKVSESLNVNLNDKSILNVMKLLLPDRLGDRDAILYSNEYRAGETGVDSFISNCWYDHISHPAIVVVKVKNGYWETVEQNYASTKYNKLESVNTFAKQKGVCLLALNHIASDTGRQWALVFVRYGGNYFSKGTHLVASLIPALIPQYFEEKPCTEDEVALLKTLTESGKAYQNFVNNYVAGYKAEMIRTQLADFSKRMTLSQIDNLKASNQSLQYDINSYLDTVRSLYDKIEDNNLRIIGLQNLPENSDEELVEYVIANKSIELTNVDNGNLYVKINTYLDNYNPDLYETISRNFSSSLYRGDLSYDYADQKLLLDAIFDKQTVKLRVTAGVGIGRYGRHGGSIWSDPIGRDDTRLTNPHIRHYECFGNNGIEIDNAVRSGDFVTALALAVSSVGNINFADGAVVPKFIHDIYFDAVACMEFPDGECLTASEAIRRLKNEQTD